MRQVKGVRRRGGWCDTVTLSLLHAYVTYNIHANNIYPRFSYILGSLLSHNKFSV